MFDKLISRIRKPDDKAPFCSDSGITSILAGIRPENAEGAVLDINHWLLETEFSVGRVNGDTLRRAVSRLDEFVQEPLCALWHAWFDPKDRLHLSNKVWQTLVAHYHALDAACARCLADPQFLSHADAGDETIACLVARRMRALVQGKKLQRLRYRAPDAIWWEEVGQLLAWARQRGVTQKMVSIYPGEAPGSVWQEYLIGVYLELAPVEGMPQSHIGTTDMLLRHFASALIVRAQPLGNEQYCLDPDSSRSIFRRDPEKTYAASVGYVGFDSLRTQLLRLLAQLTTDSRTVLLPPWLAHAGLGLPAVKDLLQLLTMAWSASPPQRRSERNLGEGHARAVFGFGLVRRMAACSALVRSGRRIDYDSYLHQDRHNRFGTVADPELQADESPDEENISPFDALARLEENGNGPTVETWIVRDISADGIGVQMPHILGRHAVGRLVGFRIATQIDWHAGIIRRLRRDGAGHSLAGIEWLPGPPQCAHVRALEIGEHCEWSTLREFTGHGFTDAILLAGTAPQILLPAGSYVKDALFRLVVAGQTRTIRLVGKVASGDDYERIDFVELEPSAGSAGTSTGQG